MCKRDKQVQVVHVHETEESVREATQWRVTGREGSLGRMWYPTCGGGGRERGGEREMVSVGGRRREMEEAKQTYCERVWVYAQNRYGFLSAGDNVLAVADVQL